MTYNVFGGTLNLAQSIHACTGILLIKPSIWVPDDSYNNLFLTQQFIPGIS